MDTSKPTGFISACRDYFGMQPGQSLVQFRDEVAALTPGDKAEIKDGLTKLGYTFKPE